MHLVGIRYSLNFSSFIFLQAQHFAGLPNCMFWTLRLLDLSVKRKFLCLLSFDNELCYLLNGCFMSPTICPEMGWYRWYQCKWKLHGGGGGRGAEWVYERPLTLTLQSPGTHDQSSSLIGRNMKTSLFNPWLLKIGIWRREKRLDSSWKTTFYTPII